jgi:hypothetical protein
MNQWEQAIDPVSGQFYYANRSTGESSWSPPAHFFSPPPPPPPQVVIQQQQQQQQHVIGQAAPHVLPLPAQSQQHYAQALNNLQQNAKTLHSSNYNVATYNLDNLLVPSIRAIIEKEKSQKTPGRKIELEGVSAGTIADLCNVSREWRSRNVHIDGGDFATEQKNTFCTNCQSESSKRTTDEYDEAANHYYMPLQPFLLPLQSRPPYIEQGRVDIRLASLYSKLGR